MQAKITLILSPAEYATMIQHLAGARAKLAPQRHGTDPATRPQRLAAQKDYEKLTALLDGLAPPA